MGTWTDSLKSLDLDGIRPMFDELAGLEKDVRETVWPDAAGTSLERPRRL